MPGYLPTLNGWRAVAILAVMLCHGSASLFAPGGVCPEPRLQAIAYRGAGGVEVFFGISGLLICSRLLDERRREGRISLRRFYIRRACRILPASFAYLGVVGLIALARPLAIDPGEWWGCVLFVRNYLPDPGHGGWYTGHFWSLAVEEHFYLLWPALLIAWGVADARRRTFALALAVAAWGALDQRERWLTALLPGTRPLSRTDVRLDGLLWGCWMALLLADPARRAWVARGLAGWRGPAVTALLLAFILARLPMEKVAVAFLVPIVLAATVLNPREALGRLLEWGPLQAIGRISYSLYLWQQLFFVPGRKLAGAPLGAWQLWPLNVAAVFACATLSYLVVERPMIRLGHLLTPANRADAGSTPPSPHVGVPDRRGAGVSSRGRRLGSRI